MPRSKSAVLDVVDAIVVAEAVASTPALIMTSARDGFRELIEAAASTDDIKVVAV